MLLEWNQKRKLGIEIKNVEIKAFQYVDCLVPMAIDLWVIVIDLPSKLQVIVLYSLLVTQDMLQMKNHHD